jgi:5S rRNA maturation endonuclease (ribonuclease M5)
MRKLKNSSEDQFSSYVIELLERRKVALFCDSDKSGTNFSVLSIC